MPTAPAQGCISPKNVRMRALSMPDVSRYAEIIRRSFETVAKDFNLTRKNCPTHTSFISNAQLSAKFKDGYYPYGCYLDGLLVGFVSLTDQGGGAYELNHLAIVPENRRCGLGKAMLDHCKATVRTLDGYKITISLLEENTTLKNWYLKNDFVHTGTRRFEHLPFTVGFMEWGVK